MPIEINWLRDYKGGDPEKFRDYQRKRFRPVEWVDEVLQLDEVWRKAVGQAQDMRKAINKLQKDVIAPKMKAKEPCDVEKAQLKAMNEEVINSHLYSFFGYVCEHKGGRWKPWSDDFLRWRPAATRCSQSSETSLILRLV